MKRQVLGVLIFVLCVAGAVTVSAQNRYRNVYSRADVDNFVRNLEASSDTFARDFKSAGGTTSNERRTVDRFENAVDRLRSRFNNTNTWWQSRNAVQTMMTEAQQVNTMMRNEAYARQLERQWRGLRRDINKLADTYELTELQGGNYGGGGGGGMYPGDRPSNAARPPDWAVGTWYWVEGPNRSFTIDRGGTVREHTGSFGEGYWDRGGIILNGNLSTVTRTRDGIRTYNSTTGETSNYTRGNGGVGVGGGEGTTSRPPSWARGTWVWVQDPIRQFTIDDSGRVVENIGGRISYGTYYNDVITLNGSTSTVTRTRNGIRTYNQSTGETSDYVRR